MRIYRDITVPPAVRNERPRIFKQTNEQTGETARTNTHIDSNKNDKKSERNTKKNTHNNQQHTVTTGWEESFVPKWISAFGKKWQNKWLGPLNSSVGKRAIVATAKPQNNVTFCLEYVCIRISRSPCMRFVCYVLGCSCWMLCFFSLLFFAMWMFETSGNENSILYAVWNARRSSFLFCLLTFFGRHRRRRRCCHCFLVVFIPFFSLICLNVAKCN